MAINVIYQNNHIEGLSVSTDFKHQKEEKPYIYISLQNIIILEREDTSISVNSTVVSDLSDVCENKQLMHNMWK